MVAQIQGMDTEYKPWGLTAGAMVGERQADMDAANLLALQESQLANVLKQRDAMEAQAQMQNPEWLKWKLAGQIGEGRSKDATGQYDQGILQDKLGASIAKFRTERGTEELNQLGNTLDLILSTYTTNGPLGLKSLQGKIPDQLFQYIATDPNAMATLTKTRDTLMSLRADTPKIRGEERIKRVEGEEAAIRQSMADDAALERQRLENASRERIAAAHDSVLKDIENNKRSFEEKALSYEQLSAYYLRKYNETDPADTASRKAWKEALEDAYRRGLEYKKAAAEARAEGEAEAFRAMRGSQGKGNTSPKPAETKGKWGVVEVKPGQ